MTKKTEDERPWKDQADRLIQVRTLMKMDQAEFAEGAGIKRGAYSNWETGLYPVSLPGARKLRKAYGLSLDFIFEGDTDALPMSLRIELTGKGRKA